MGRLVGYMANRADRLADALYQERAMVAPRPAGGPTGWGIGFYQGGEVLHKKRPRLEGEPIDWPTIGAGVKSDVVLLHLRQPTVGDFRAENTHPFRMQRWLFAHNGTIERFDAIKDRVLESVPDFLRRNIRGQTDSEHFFHVVLSFLHDSGQLGPIDVDPEHVLSAIRSAVAMVDRLSAEVGGAPATLNMLLTNGRSMYGLRRGAPMAFVERSGLHDPRVVQDSPAPRDPSTLRYVMVVSDGSELPPDWKPMEAGSVAVVNRDLQLSAHTL